MGVAFGSTHPTDGGVVVEGNLITSRQPSDIPAFVRAIEEKVAAHV